MDNSKSGDEPADDSSQFEGISNLASDTVDSELLERTEKSGIIRTKFLSTNTINNYINTKEKVKFLIISESHPILMKEVDSEETESLDGEGCNYLIVTNKRLLFLIGDKDGDEFVEFDLLDMSDIGVSEDGAVSVYIEDEGNYSINPNSDIESLEDEIKAIYEIIVDNETEGDWVETVAHVSTYGDVPLPEGREVNIRLTENSFVLPNKEKSIQYSSLCQVKHYTYRDYKYSDMGDVTIVDKYDVIRKKGCVIRFKVEGGGLLYIHKLTSTNSSINKSSMSMSSIELEIVASMDEVDKPRFRQEIIDFVEEHTPEKPLDGVPEEVLVEKVGPKSTLRIEGWESNQSEIKLTGSSTGKSKGYEIGPFTRSKSTSESVMTGQITQDEWENRITAALAFEDRMYIDSSPEIELLYQDISQIMRSSQDGTKQAPGGTTYQVVISTNNNSFRLFCDASEEAVSNINNRVLNHSQKDAQVAKQASSVSDRVEELKKMYDKGLIDKDKFESKKEELLDEL